MSRGNTTIIIFFEALIQLAYHGFQLCCFLAMALLVMRLKLFATPQLCLFCTVLANNRLLASAFGRPLGILRIFLIGILLAGMAQKGRENVREQLEMKSEFNNPEQEKLFTWILTTTPKGEHNYVEEKTIFIEAVFAGTMALMVGGMENYYPLLIVTYLEGKCEAEHPPANRQPSALRE